ncbi:MAG: RagB/SusD family nutrient uptake outer membrane protein [Marinifilaceae bacterium]
MKTNIKKYILLAAVALGATMTSCVDDLDTTPIDPDYKSGDKIYVSAESYKQGLAKLYGSFVLAGQEGSGGNADIAGGDPGSTVYTRLLYYCQELTTDEAIVAWNDGDIKEFHNQKWTAGNGFVGNMYTRLYLTIGFINQYLRDTEPGKLISNLTAEDEKNIHTYRAEARLLRAMVYYNALDLFGSVPILTEQDPVGNFKPDQKTKKEVFAFVESEVEAVVDQLSEPGNHEYGRIDKGAAWALLARMYLNAEVYINEAKYTECIENCKKLFPYYSLNSSYAELFMADNHLRTNEMIFAFACDGLSSQTYGATTYIVHAAIGGDYKPADAGINSGWGGNRVTSAFVNKFDLDKDQRAMFFSEGQSLEIDKVSEFTEGYMLVKYTNKNSDGTNGSDDTYVDTDFPMFRLADAYLMYAEAVLRGGNGGTKGEALALVNQIRTRAYGDVSGNISDADLTLDFILDERARELSWECMRRTDLIRFGKFSKSDYVWPWKGGIKEGKSVDSHFNLFPIPLSELNSNSNLKPTPGY